MWSYALESEPQCLDQWASYEELLVATAGTIGTVGMLHLVREVTAQKQQWQLQKKLA